MNINDSVHSTRIVDTNFRPLPLLGGPHTQTVLGVLLNYWQPGLACRCRPVRLPDGDHLLMYDTSPRHWQAGDPLALAVHGLASSHRSGALVRLGRLLLHQGIRVVRLDLRSAGRGMRYARKTYNAACSEDVRAAAVAMAELCPGSPLILVGFSLGGNIVLKLAGEAVARPLAGLAGVAAANPPIDLEACAVLLAQPANLFYTRYFARNLVKHVRLHQSFFPDLPVVDFPKKDLTLRQFDELYTAPRGGFADAADYYRRASALPLVPGITVPTLILTARDDPFVAVEPIADLPRRAELEVRIARQGGHLGYIGMDDNWSLHWAERQLAAWIVETLAQKKTPAAVGQPPAKGESV